MKSPALSTSLRRVFLSAIAATSLCSGGHAFGQVNGVGPSDPSLFDNVLTIPTDPDIGNSQSFGGVAGETTQFNLSDGGNIGSQADFNSGVELNISGGLLRRNAEATEGSEVNISGGTIGTEFRIDGAEANISGGFFEGLIAIGGGRGPATNNVAVTGGVFNDFRYTSSTFRSPVNAAISGGNFRGDFTVFRFNDDAAPTGQIELIGGDFQVNGTSISGATLTLAEGDVFTGTLQDGSGFLFSSLTGDDIEQLSLTRVSLPPINTDPIVVNTPQTSDIFVRSGQTLTVQDGGELEFSQTSGATVNIDGGSFSNGEVFDSTVNVSGGTASFDSLSSEVNISGGVVQGGLGAYSSEINVSGGTASGISAISDSVVNVSGGTANGSARQNSVLNVNGGTVDFSVGNSSVANITGGTVSLGSGFGNGARPVINISGDAIVTSLEDQGSEVNISGGTFSDYTKGFTSIVRISGGTFTSLNGNGIELVGGDYKLNGIDFTGSTLDNLSSEDVFTGTLQDGASFIFSPLAGSRPSSLTLSSEGPLPFIDTTPIVVNTATSLLGLREGQTLTLQDGGDLTNFRSVGGTLNQEGGNLGRTALASGGVVNISGGSVGDAFTAFLGSEVNISGGTIGDRARFYDSTINITGGTIGAAVVAERSTINISGGRIQEIGSATDITISDGSVASISGGDVGRVRISSGSEVDFSGGRSTFLFAEDDSQLTVTGGTAGVSARDNSNVDISGGNISFFSASSESNAVIRGGNFGDFSAGSGSNVQLIGGEFKLNGSVFDGTNVSLENRTDFVSGVLEDGSTFIFENTSGSISELSFSRVTLPTFDSSRVVDTAFPTGPSGLRDGQTLTLVDGGVLGDNFQAIGGVVNVNGGSFAGDTEIFDALFNLNEGQVEGVVMLYSDSKFNVFGGNINELIAGSGSEFNMFGGNINDIDAGFGSEINIRGGTISGLDAGFGSEINVHGGIFESRLIADADSTIEFFATEFFIDGNEVEFTDINTPLLIENRSFLLSGLFLDGTEFEYVVGSFRTGNLIVSPDATFQLNLVSVVPEPSGAFLLALSGTMLLVKRRRA